MKSNLAAATLTLNPAIDRTVTIPNFAAGAVNRVETASDTPGGKGVNVALALAASGLRTAVTGFLGRENAAPFQALFADRQIVDRFIRIPGATRIGIKIIDPIRSLTTDINFPGPAPQPGHLAALLETLASIESPWWVVAGSLPPGMDPAIYREIITTLKRGARVALDASGEALRHAIEAGPYMIKPNLDELQALLGERLTRIEAIIAAARKLLSKGIELAVVSMGGEGACFVTETEAVIARPPAIEVRSTVGAGDAMVAGIVAAQIRGLPLEECARLASAFSLRRLTHAEPSPAALEAAIRQITIETPTEETARLESRDAAPCRAAGG
jgi:1-phosphofructokinase